MEIGAQGLEQDLARALSGDVQATGRLVHGLTPIVHVRAVRALMARGRAARGRNIRQEVEDVAQDVLCLLFADDSRILRGWDKGRGLSLLNFVGLVAEREVGHILRSGRRSPWTLDPTTSEEMETSAGTSEGPEARLASKQMVDQVWQRLREELSPKGIEIFKMLLVEERAVEEVCQETGLNVDAVYAWRSRLLKRTRSIAKEISADLVSEKGPLSEKEGAQANPPVSEGGV